jgi:hypothetical protein
MFVRIVKPTIVAIMCLMAQVAQAQTLTTKQISELLVAQNRYRIEVAEQPLFWSNTLAAGAQEWAEHLAGEVHSLQHSHLPGLGENLAMWTAGRATLTKLVDLWGAEKYYFIDSTFPDVSTTGDWKTVGHYTQMIWRSTTEVGCGMASGGGYDYLVCRYTPQGNFMGERVF